MSANGVSFGGYDCSFVEPPPDELLCLICTFVAKEPKQMDCCGKIYCRTCLEVQKKHSNLCPQCREQGTIFNDKKSNRNIKALKVKCSNGSCCTWEGELGSLQDHINTCEHTLLCCPNECEREEGKLQLLRKDLNSHLSECLNRNYNCPHCNEEGKYCEITTNHLQTCSKIKITCPNAECGKKRLRGDIEEHRETCPYEELSCKYAEIGCERKRIRKEKDEHESDDQFHIHIALETILQLKQQDKSLLNDKQATKVIESPTDFPSFTFKMPNFSWYKESGERFDSPPFHTHQGGYKMHLGIWANGICSGRGTHISVGVYAMEGENDDNLTWPLEATATITLLNQLQGDEHIISSYPTHTYDRYYVGIQLYYCSHEKLDHNEATKCQYLKDDCLYFVKPTNLMADLQHLMSLLLAN